MKLNQKVYLITGVGGSNSLGSMIVNKILEINKNVFDVKIICCTEFAPVPEVFSFDEQYVCDLNESKEIERVFALIQKNNPEIDYVINCAGISIMDWFDDLNMDDVEKSFKINCLAPIQIIQTLLPSLIEAKGTVLNILSTAATVPFRTSLPYNVSKAALRMATMQLARELTPKYGITVFGISPNELSDTNMTLKNTKQIQDIRGWSLSELEAKHKAGALTGKRGNPLEFALFVSKLLSRKEAHENLSGCDIPYGL